MVLLPLLAVLACRPPPPDTGDSANPRGPDPWDALEPVALDPFRLLAQTPLDGAVAPDRLARLGGRSLTFVRDEAAGRVHVMDALYHQSGAAWCLDTGLWPDFDDPDLQGPCATGQVQVARGRLQTRTDPAAVAVDPEGLRVFVVARAGEIQVAPADILSGNPFRYLRLEDPVPLQDVPGLDGPSGLAWVEDRLWLASGEVLASFSDDGTPLETKGLGAATVDMAVVDGVPWVLTDRGVMAGGDLLEVQGTRILGVEGGAWVADPDASALHRIDGRDVTTVEVQGISGPLGLDPGSGLLYVGVSDGVAVLREGEEQARYPVGPVLDLAVGAAHEIVGLGTDGTVRVWVDETALVASGPVDVAVAAFMERPRSSDPAEELPCMGEDSVRTCMALAASQRPFLDDLPAPVALGLIPHMVERAQACDVEEDLETAWRAPRTEVGVLYHDEPAQCTGDPTCVAAFLEEERGRLLDVGATPTWSSGLSPFTELDVDWVEVMASTQTPLAYYFFGMSLLDSVAHLDDPRSKDAWPVDLDRLSAGWTASSVPQVQDGAPGGKVAFYPGNNTPNFNLGGCPNLLLNECHATGVGGGNVIDASDLAAMDLLLHRAVAMATGDGPHTWYFHLADIGTYDYLDGCTETDRVWSGDACQGALLQTWLLGVHQRFVSAGLVRWTLPSALAWPG